MKLKIVFGYFKDDSYLKDIRQELIGQTFNSFNKVLDALKFDEHVTVEDKSTRQGYKEVWKDSKGEWIQRRWAPEY